MSVPQNSRNNWSALMRVIDSEGNVIEPEHLDIRPHLVDTKHSDNTIVTVQGGENWSRLSWRTLGHGRHWWIIADYTGVVDPFEEIRAREVKKFVAQLTADMSAGPVATFLLTSARRVKRGSRLRVEDLATGNSFDLTVISVNVDTGRVVCNATVAPAITAATSKVSLLLNVPAKAVVPSPQRAFFEALDFGNPMRVLVT